MPRETPSLPPAHPLLRLEGRRLTGGRLRVLPGPVSRIGALYFSLHLQQGSSLSREPILIGLHHTGPYPGYNWIEVAQVNERLTFEGGVEPAMAIGAAGLRRLMALLGDLIPPGGHLMLEYESPRWASTARALNLGAPPPSETGTSLREGARAPASCRASSPWTRDAPDPLARRETESCTTSWPGWRAVPNPTRWPTPAVERAAFSVRHALSCRS